MCGLMAAPAHLDHVMILIEMVMRSRQTRLGASRGVIRTLSTMAASNDLAMNRAATAATIDPFIERFTRANAPEKPATEVGGDGPRLDGVRVAVKDLFDVRGTVNGFGSPAYSAAFPKVADSSAKVVTMLTDAGAELAGKVHLDEIAYSLQGENAQYGTPINPVAPKRIPGGSSSGCASAVMMEQSANHDGVLIGLGSDTAGSIRVPAAFCGCLGFRPTHGRVTLEGAKALAPSYDTPGILARIEDVEIMRTAMEVLLKKTGQEVHDEVTEFNGWKVATDAFALADPDVANAIYKVVAAKKPEWCDVFGGEDSVEMTIGSQSDNGNETEFVGSPQDWIDVFRITQGREIWQEHGDWITRHGALSSFGPGIKERFQMTSRITDEEYAKATKMRETIKEHVLKLFQSNNNNEQKSAIIIPTAPTIAPLLASPQADLDDMRRRLISLCSLASLCGLPQVTLPLAHIPVEDGTNNDSITRAPVGVSIVGPPNSDKAVLNAAVRICKHYIL